jgi:hypothetical protein
VPHLENIDSDHILVVIKLRYRINRASNTTPQQLKLFAVGRLNDGNVEIMYRHKLEAELSGEAEPEPLSLNDKWKRMVGAVRKVATNTIGYTRKQAGKEWFDEEYERVNEEKTAKYKYSKTRSIERNLFEEKSWQLDEETLIEIERYRSIRDSRKFFKRLNDVKRPFEAQVAMCCAKNGELLTKKEQVPSRWKGHFENICFFGLRKQL